MTSTEMMCQLRQGIIRYKQKLIERIVNANSKYSYEELVKEKISVLEEIASTEERRKQLWKH